MRSYQTKRTPIYGNCIMLSPNGTMMCRCDSDKIEWYLSRSLATVVEAEPLTIRLNFEPKGDGHAGNLYYLSEKGNICCVCGSDKELTRHHIVPRLYRRNFPSSYKKHCSHDIVPICSDCHANYEIYADQLKSEIAKEFTAHFAIGPVPDKKLLRVRSAANALLRFRDRMPPERVQHLLNIVNEYLGKEPENSDLLICNDLIVCSRDNVHSNDAFNVGHGEKVAQEILSEGVDGEKFKEFIRRWRQHFLDSVFPKHMPTGWSVAHGLKLPDTLERNAPS
jgi:hypothetical protein